MVDWQFLGTESIFLDFGLLAYLSMSPEETETNFEKMVSAFHDRYMHNAHSSKVLWIIFLPNK